MSPVEEGSVRLSELKNCTKLILISVSGILNGLIELTNCVRSAGLNLAKLVNNLFLVPAASRSGLISEVHMAGDVAVG